MTEEQRKLYRDLMDKIQKFELELKRDNDHLKYLKARCVEDETYELIKFLDKVLKLNQDFNFNVGALLHLLPDHGVEASYRSYNYLFLQHHIDFTKIKLTFEKETDGEWDI
jgi:hypothetical protein